LSTYDRPLPDVTRPRTEEFWSGTQQGQIRLQRCDACGYLRFPPARICPECLAAQSRWTELRPSGKLYSFATYRRAFDKRFERHLPYTVAYVELDDGPRMVGTLIAGAEQAAVGSRVTAVFDPVTPEVTLVRWALEAP
jgi:uncharacterized protein